ncbi:MAG TPA: hypothetical protein VFB96_21465 [Pirellulaceae bacterium]|nr:hypothetical protein [Pirellulaceae bacterium]
MRSVVMIAVLVVGLCIAGLVLSSLWGRTERPQPIRNPYVNR